MGGYIGSQIPSFIADVTSASGDFAVGDDLTVDTNTLYVDSTNNRVGVGTSSPNNVLEVRGTSSGQNVLQLSNSAGTSDGNAENQIRVTCNGNANWANLDIQAYQTIFTQNGTERMRIDSAGRVTMPYQVSFMAASASGFNTNGYLSSFSNVHHNVGGHFNNSNGLFTAPISGTYLFVAGVLVETSTGRLEYKLNYNGGNYVSGNGTGTTYDGPTITAMVQMGANDYVRIDRVSGTAHGNGAHNNTYFGGYLIG